MALFFPPFSDSSQSVHLLQNRSAFRIAIKVLVSHVDLYRVRPVYAILEPEGSKIFHILRKPHPADGSQDKIIILVKDAPNQTELNPVKEAEEIFKDETGTLDKLKMELRTAEETPLTPAQDAILQQVQDLAI